MLKFTRSLTKRLLILVLFVVTFLNLNCDNPEYVSPTPGVLEIRLKTVSKNILPDPLNNFVLKVTEVLAQRSSGSYVEVFEDVKAIDRSPTVFNLLSKQAEDSSLVIGQCFVPPDNYTGVALLLEPGPEVVLDGYRIIGVDRLPDFEPLLVFGGSFSVGEGDTTRIVLTVDLDSTLRKRSETYLFVPKYYVSSITRASETRSASVRRHVDIGMIQKDRLELGERPQGWESAYARNGNIVLNAPRSVVPIMPRFPATPVISFVLPRSFTAPLVSIR